jgi:hypothetical protein
LEIAVTQTRTALDGPKIVIARSNRRALIRYRCAPATIGKVTVPGDQLFQRAWIQDLSLHGIGIDLPRPIPKGSFIVISVKTNDGRKTYELAAEVMHCSAQPHEQWHLGCEFTTPLTPDDLDLLL